MSKHGNRLSLLQAAVTAIIAGNAAMPVLHAQPADDISSLLALSIEELSTITITSVSRQPESLIDAVASIYVITPDDIRSAGATTIPEALRLAPNLHVARGDAGQYAISARGFNSAIGNKLLILIDGRTVYSPFFAGVFWTMQDALMEDIERIEVISGPGGTLWGSNAVNGVINIITRAPVDTQGLLLTGNAGNMERAAGMRYGGELGGNGHFRIWAKAQEIDNTRRANGTPVPDDFDRARIGFRAGWSNSNSNFTVQGDAYDGSSDQANPGETTFSGSNVLARYTRQFTNASELRVQAYYDRAERDNETVFKDEVKTQDLEIQYKLPPLANHQVLVGGGHREAMDRTTSQNPAILFIPENKNLKWSSLFVQDSIALPSSLELTLGVKWEENVYTGKEFLPSGHLSWQPDPTWLLWGKVARAVRAPARLDRDFYIPVIGINGGPEFQAEISNVTEIGYRAQPSQKVSYSLTAFHHDHDKQRSGEPNPNGPGFVVSNTIEGTTKGLEGWVHYQPLPGWRLSGGFIHQDQDLQNEPGSLDPTGPIALGNDPDRIWSIRSTYNIDPRHQVFLSVRHASTLPDPAAPSYTAVDARYGWRISNDLEISLVAQNLFDSSHSEFGDPLTNSHYERTAFMQVVWKN